jgi:hypothetical protein
MIKGLLSKEITLLNDPSVEKLKEIEDMSEKMLEGILVLGKRLKHLEDAYYGTKQTPVYSSQESASMLDNATDVTKKKILDELNEAFAEWWVKKQK